MLVHRFKIILIKIIAVFSYRSQQADSKIYVETKRKHMLVNES